MRVLTFSIFFQKGHPRAGQPTYFVEKIMAALADEIEECKMYNDFILYDWYEYYNATPKHHTIRAGNRWKVGDKASLRVWSDKPYKSKQIEFAQVEVKKIWAIELRMTHGGNYVECFINGEKYGVDHDSQMCDQYNWELLARNDGLNTDDFIAWFNLHPKTNKDIFRGQIICWNDSIDYFLNSLDTAHGSVATEAKSGTKSPKPK